MGVVTVRNVPLTTWVEDIVLSTVSKNSGKGRIAMEYVVDKLKNETRPISDYLDKLKLEVIDLKHLVSENVIKTATTNNNNNNTNNNNDNNNNKQQQQQHPQQ